MIFVNYDEILPLFLCIMEKIIFSVLHKNENEFLSYPIIEICRKLCYNKDLK